MNLQELILRLLDEQKWREQKVKQLPHMRSDLPQSDAEREPFQLRMLYQNPLLADANRLAHQQSIDLNTIRDAGTPPGFLESFIQQSFTNNRQDRYRKLMNLM